MYDVEVLCRRLLIMRVSDDDHDAAPSMANSRSSSLLSPPVPVLVLPFVFQLSLLQVECIEYNDESAKCRWLFRDRDASSPRR